jgi:hypothetical protein
MAKLTTVNETKTTEIKIDGVELDVEHSAISRNEYIWEADIDLYSVKINNQEVPLDWFTRDLKNDMVVQIRLHENKDRYSEEESQGEAKSDESRGR